MANYTLRLYNSPETITIDDNGEPATLAHIIDLFSKGATEQVKQDLEAHGYIVAIKANGKGDRFSVYSEYAGTR